MASSDGNQEVARRSVSGSVHCSDRLATSRSNRSAHSRNTRLRDGKLPNGATISGGGGEHRAGLDLTFNAPKSVSLVALLGGDRRVVAAHLAAVRNTMQWAESRLALDGGRYATTHSIRTTR